MVFVLTFLKEHDGKEYTYSEMLDKKRGKKAPKMHPERNTPNL